eukprot:439463-Amphidinium_carterae.1
MVYKTPPDVLLIAVIALCVPSARNTVHDARREAGKRSHQQDGAAAPPLHTRGATPSVTPDVDQ